MKKLAEMVMPDSCWSKAGMHETVFVLLARDAAAPVAIRAWAAERIRLGKNTPEDEQIVEALESAEQMREEYVGLHTPGAVKP